MASHDTPSPSLLHPTPTPPTRPTRPRLSRGISARRPQPPPVPPSLRDHPLLDVVAAGGNLSNSASCSSSDSSTTTPISSHSRRSSVSASSPPSRPADKIPLPSPTGLWMLPPRRSPPTGGPWTEPIENESEPVRDAMCLWDTVPAGSTTSAASPAGYPWHKRAYGHDSAPVLPTPGNRPAQPNPQSSPNRQRRQYSIGTLHTHSPQPSPPVTPAAA